LVQGSPSTPLEAITGIQDCSGQIASDIASAEFLDGNSWNILQAPAAVSAQSQLGYVFHIEKNYPISLSPTASGLPPSSISPPFCSLRKGPMNTWS